MPFAGVGVDQVAPEQEAGDFVVEADRVVADADGARLGQLAFDGGGKLLLRHPEFGAALRRDAGEQAGFRRRQVVAGRLAVQHHRLADFVEFGIGADAGKLRRTVAARHGAEGFVVVPEEGRG
ncbi:hypothetical protein D3C85_1463580 [compost metagenome]